MAKETGVEVRLNTRVIELLRKGNRVTGVRTIDRDGKVASIESDLVVGADGRLSTVAQLAGARRYHVVPSERISSWAYFRGVPPQPLALLYYHRRGDDFVVAAPADDDLFLVALCPSVEYFDAYRADSEGWFSRAVAGCPPVADLVANAKRVTKFRGLTRFEGFFREATGPGWVLVGDSGHFKDPTPGQGISDALRQVERLWPAILHGFEKPAERDSALRDWGRWRDHDSIGHYWFCSDVGKRGSISPVLLEILRRISANDERRKDFLDIFLHRKYPRDVIGARDLASATLRLLADAANRPGALGEASKLFREDLGRRMRAWKPRFDEGPVIDEPHFDYQPSAA